MRISMIFIDLYMRWFIGDTIYIFMIYIYIGEIYATLLLLLEAASANMYDKVLSMLAAL